MLLVLFALLLLSVYVRWKKQVLFLWMMCAVIALISGIRWYSGTDFLVYQSVYENVEDTKFPFFRRPDFLYYIIAAIFSRLTLTFTVFLIFTSAVCWYLHFIAIQKFGHFPQIALVVLFSTTIGLLGSERENLALALCFLAVVLMLNKYKISYLLCALAVLFHFSAIVMLPVFFLNRDFSKKTYLIFGTFSLFFIVFPLENTVRELFINNNMERSYIWSHLQQYFNITPEARPSFTQLFFGVLRRLIIILPFFFVPEIRNWKYYLVLRNIALLSLVMYLICVVHFTFLLGRLTIYYQIFDALSLALFATYFYETKYKNHFLAFVTVYSVFIFFKSIAPYPQLFIPYRTVFGTF